MGWFKKNSVQALAHAQVINAPHKAALSHGLIAGAAAYEAANAYENYVSKNGKPDNHAKAKEIVAGFAGAFIDNIAETKGLDNIDLQKAKDDANAQAHESLADEYTN